MRFKGDSNPDRLIPAATYTKLPDTADAIGSNKLMNDEFLKLFEAAKALVTYIDQEQVFDRVADMGCGGVDIHQSETFYDLIANARRAILVFETKLRG
jgi:hypothetical protein